MTTPPVAVQPRTGPVFLSVVLSFYNEEAVIPELLRRLRNVMQRERAAGRLRGYELIFVNDASNDGSMQLLEAECREAGDVVVVDMSRNFGISECVMAGLAYSRGDAAIYMDSDLQDPPELISELLEAFQSDRAVEVVYTTRRRRHGENALKMLATKLGYRLVNYISEIHLPVDSGDFKLLSRRVVSELLRLNETRPYMRGLISWVGFKQKQVFYDRDPRLDGAAAGKCPPLSRKVINYHLDRALISFSDVPLKISLLLGFSVSSISLLYILVVLLQKYMGWHVPGWPALMAAILLLGGMNLMVLGILGLYINLIFLASKGRPNYIVNKVVRQEDLL